MKRFLHLALVTAILTIIPLSLEAQCKGFAKKICKLELDEYIHDGNYHAAVLTEGEEAELYKTFYSDQEYRIAICGSDALPEVEFKVIDSNRKVLFNNTEDNNTRVWDFKLESSQQLKIFVKVPVNSESADNIVSGCVSIMFGFKDK